MQLTYAKDLAQHQTTEAVARITQGLLGLPFLRGDILAEELSSQQLDPTDPTRKPPGQGQDGGNGTEEEGKLPGQKPTRRLSESRASVSMPSGTQQGESKPRRSSSSGATVKRVQFGDSVEVRVASPGFCGDESSPTIPPPQPPPSSCPPSSPPKTSAQLPQVEPQERDSPESLECEFASSVPPLNAPTPRLDHSTPQIPQLVALPGTVPMVNLPAPIALLPLSGGSVAPLSSWEQLLSPELVPGEETPSSQPPPGQHPQSIVPNQDKAPDPEISQESDKPAMVARGLLRRGSGQATWTGQASYLMLLEQHFHKRIQPPEKKAKVSKSPLTLPGSSSLKLTKVGPCKEAAQSRATVGCSLSRGDSKLQMQSGNSRSCSQPLKENCTARRTGTFADVVDLDKPGLLSSPSSVASPTGGSPKPGPRAALAMLCGAVSGKAAGAGGLGMENAQANVSLSSISQASDPSVWSDTPLNRRRP